MKRRTKQVFAVVERDVNDRDYCKVLETTSDERFAWGRVRYLTQTRGGGGRYYEVKPAEQTIDVRLKESK